jgi:hypothetical protein
MREHEMMQKVVVVLAFKAVYTLELKHRSTEKKIIALYAEMKDMMGVLFVCVMLFIYDTLLISCSLNDMPAEHDDLIGPDGRNIADRLGPLVKCTADDIELCSNDCNTYVKKRPLAKWFQAPLWDDKLLNFVKLFSKRRQEFEFELSIHTGRGVDKANAKLITIEDQTKALDEKFSYLCSSLNHILNLDTGWTL